MLFEAEANFKGIERAQHEIAKAAMHSIHLSTWKTKKPTVPIPFSPGS